MKSLILSFFIIFMIVIILISCAPMEEEYPPKWVIASQYLPREKISGMQQAGFFTMNGSIYSHHCDKHGNMIRLKYDEENKTWRQIKYETLGCVE